MNKEFPNLPGKRVNLRPLTSIDLPLTLAWRNDPSIRLWFVYSEIITWEQHQKFYCDYLMRPDDFIYIIELNDHEHNPVGQISLYNVNNENKTAEFGRLMIGEKTARGRGFAAEASTLIIEDAFLNKSLSEIYLDVFTENQSAVHTYSKLGFKVAFQNNNMLHMILKANDFKQSNA